MSGILKYFGKKRKKTNDTESNESESQGDVSVIDENVGENTPTTSNAASVIDENIGENTLTTSKNLTIDSVSEMSIEIENVDSHPKQDSEIIEGGPRGSNEESVSLSRFFDNKSRPYQPHLKVYPSQTFGRKVRRFSSDWYSRYKWLEYNEEKDAAFCFACRVFNPNPSEKKFTHIGFRDWHHALDAGKGFPKHNVSRAHENSMKNWASSESENSEGGSTVARAFVSINSDQKKWLFAVFNVTKYLSANGLPFRGSDESDIKTADGLYLRAFSQLLFPLEPNWEKIHNRLPKNAKYTSHDIQNEVIEVLASLVKETIAEDVRKAQLFTIMADGTTDKNRKEIQGLVCRYLLTDGKVEEHCLSMKGIEDRSAQGIFNFVKDTLGEFQISVDGLVSQSFDGASVMSGDYGGLQKLISDFCDRYVLYVHCFLHKIHLVVSFVMSNLEEVSEYFSVITALYKFFKKSAVLESYDGTPLKRLIETRWSGHFESTSHVNKNYANVLEALRAASKNKKLKSEDRALAIGLLSQMGDNEEDPVFVFINCLLMDVLKPIDIVVKTLQSPDENFISALDIVNSVQEDIKSKREHTDSDDLRKMTKELNKQRRPKRSTSIPSYFDNFVVTESLPSENIRRPNIQIFTECLDLLLAEFTRRFSTENLILWEAMSALSPSSTTYLEYNTLKPLFDYAKKIPTLRDFYVKENLSEKDLEAECRIFTRVLKDKEKEWPKDVNGRIDLVEVARIVMNDYQNGAPILSSLYKLAITAGFTSTRVECVFSSLTRVDSPQRRSMKTDRECDLAYLAFESDILINKITFEDFYKRWTSKPRALPF